MKGKAEATKEREGKWRKGTEKKYAVRQKARNNRYPVHHRIEPLLALNIPLKVHLVSFDPTLQLTQGKNETPNYHNETCHCEVQNNA